MKKKFLALLLALSVALLCACANTEEHTSETTKATISPSVINISANGLKLSNISIVAGEQKVEPFFVLCYANSDGAAADGPLMFGYPETHPDMFYTEKKQYPIIYCDTLEEIKFYVGDTEQQGIAIYLFDSEGEPVEFTGSGTYYAYAKVQSEMENNRSAYGAFFTIRPVGTENEPIEETYGEDYKLNVNISGDPLVTVTDTDFTKSANIFIFDIHESSLPYIAEETMDGYAAKLIYEELEKMTPSGEKAEAIAEGKTLDEGDRERLLTEGTIWIETDDAIFRIDKDEKIAKVETFLGAGEYLESESSFAEILDTIIDYYPKNTYLGSIDGQDLDMRHICKADSDIELDISYIGARLRRTGTSARTFVITLELTSGTDASIKLFFGSSFDGTYSENVPCTVIELKAGVAEKVTLRRTLAADEILYLAAADHLILIEQ